MNKKRRVKPPQVKDYLYETEVLGKKLIPGTEVAIRGLKSRYRFLYATITSQGLLVLTFIGGARGKELMRSFYPERVKQVYRAKKHRPNPMIKAVSR